MATKIAGMSQKELYTQLGISRATLNRHRNAPWWPGDDASFSMIEAIVNANRTTQGRKAKPVAAGPAPEDPDDETYEELIKQQDLGYELKRSQIDKNNASIGKYTLHYLAAYRKELTGDINRAHDRFFDELEHCDLDREQLINVRNALRRCQAEVAGEKAGEIQPELLME